MAQEMSPKLYAQHVGIDEGSVWDWIGGRGPVLFDERDIRPVHGHLWLIAVQAPNAAGLGARPQFKENPAYRYMRRKKSVHKSGSGCPVDVIPLKDAGVACMADPATENIHRDTPLGMIGAIGMAEALEVPALEAMP